MAALTELTLAEARAGLGAKKFSARELASAYIAAMERARPLNAFVTETPERALAMAAESDRRLARGAALRLEGMPLAIKDLFCTEGVLTTAGSHILAGFKPPYESTVTAKLWQAGAVMLGKGNMDEFAMGSANITCAHGKGESPWRRRRDKPPPVPGGSSGGPGGAVGARVAGMPAEIEALWQRGIDWLKAAEAQPVEISLKLTRYALATYYIIAPAEASSNLARYDGVRFGLRVPGQTLDEMYENTRAEGFGAEVKRRILIGTYVLSAGYYDAYYLKAQQARTLIPRDFAQAFARCDVILTPTAPSAAFAIGEKMDDPIAMYLNDVFTVPVNLAGLPGISVPAGLSGDGLPLGLQIIGRAFDEATVLRVGEAIERAANFTARPQFLTSPPAGRS